MILAWASAIALAGGYYDPSEVAARSLSFARASEAMMPPFEHAETAASGMAGALREWEEAIDLLGDRAPAGEREALDGARTTFFRERAVLARFAVEQAEGFDQLFRDAIERAVNGRALSACTPRSGLRMAPGRNPEVRCAGEDHTAEVVSHVDGDARLAAGIDALLGRSWPELRVEITPLPMTEGAPVFVGSFFHRAVPDQLGDIDRADSEARLPFEAAIEAGSSR